LIFWNAFALAVGGYIDVVVRDNLGNQAQLSTPLKTLNKLPASKPALGRIIKKP
jgi:hypothetical protein